MARKDDGLTPAERRAKRWRETKGDLKWAIALLFFLVLVGPIAIPAFLRVTGIGRLLGIAVGDPAWPAWYKAPGAEEDLGKITDAIFAQDGLVVPFEVLSVLLLAALIAGVVIAFRDPEVD